jgi:hypothetical protein
MQILPVPYYLLYDLFRTQQRYMGVMGIPVDRVKTPPLVIFDQPLKGFRHYIPDLYQQFIGVLHTKRHIEKITKLTAH